MNESIPWMFDPLATGKKRMHYLEKLLLNANNLPPMSVAGGVVTTHVTISKAPGGLIQAFKANETPCAQQKRSNCVICMTPSTNHILCL